MASVNKVILIGNLGKDPEIRTTPQGTSLARFSVATTTNWKDSSGARQEKTEWHDVVAWEKLAQICGEYLHKGKMVYVEGSLQTRSWEDQNGQKRYKTEVKANNVVMLSPRDASRAPGAAAGTGTAPREVSEVAEAPAYDDDVPF
jgi:single-strand DNA-binding protein